MSVIHQTTLHDPMAENARTRLRELITNTMLLLFVNAHNSIVHNGDYHSSWHILLLASDGDHRSSAINVSALVAQALGMPYIWDDTPGVRVMDWNHNEILSPINAESVMARLAHILYPDPDYPLCDPEQFKLRIEFENRMRVL